MTSLDDHTFYYSLLPFGDPRNALLFPLLIASNAREIGHSPRHCAMNILRRFARFVKSLSLSEGTESKEPFPPPNCPSDVVASESGTDTGTSSPHSSEDSIASYHSPSDVRVTSEPEHQSRHSTPIGASLDVLLDHQYLTLSPGLPIIVTAGVEEYLVVHVKDVQGPAHHNSPGCVRMIAHHPTCMPAVNRHITVSLGSRICVVNVLKSLSTQQTTLQGASRQLLEDQYTLVGPGMPMIVSAGDYDYLVRFKEFIFEPLLQVAGRPNQVRIIAPDGFAIPGEGNLLTVLLGDRACLVRIEEKLSCLRNHDVSPSSAQALQSTPVRSIPTTIPANIETD